MPRDWALSAALRLCGAGFCMVYGLAIIWPAGWKWHRGAAATDPYCCMIAGIYATLGVFLIAAARAPRAHRSLIRFTIWSCIVHAAIMAWQGLRTSGAMGHFLGDIPALLLAAALLQAAWWRSAHNSGEGSSRD